MTIPLPFRLFAILGCMAAAGGVGAQVPDPRLQSDTADAQYHVMVGELAALRYQPELAAAEFLKALELVPDADLAMRAAGLALLARNEKMALKAARRWQQLDGNNMDAREAVARLALRAGDRGEAQAQCEGIIRGHAGGIDDGFRAVALLLALEDGSKADALSIMAGLRAQWPQASGAWHAQSLLALRFDELELAEQSARQALKLEPGSRDTLMLLTGVLVKRADVTGAERLLKELLKDSPDPASLRMDYARLLLQADRVPEARRQFEAILSAQPDHEEAHYGLGLLALGEDDLDTADAQFRALLEDDTLRPAAAYYLGRVEELRRRPEKALEWYAQVTQGDHAVDAVIRRAAVLARTGKLPEGRHLLSQLRELMPGIGVRAVQAEAEILLDVDQPQEALKLYADALAESPENEDLLYGRSLVYDRMKEVKAAEADLRRILAQNKDDARALNALGYMLTVHTRRLEEARDLITRALELTPDDAAVIDSMGWLEFRAGRLQESRALLEKAFRKAKDPEIAAHYGEVLWALGDKTRARAVWNGALSRDPDHKVLRETIDRLAK